MDSTLQAELTRLVTLVSVLVVVKLGSWLLGLFVDIFGFFQRRQAFVLLRELAQHREQEKQEKQEIQH